MSVEGSDAPPDLAETMARWLALHETSVQQVLWLLSRDVSTRPAPNGEGRALDAEAAWELTVQSIANSVPCLKDVAMRTSDLAIVDFREGVRSRDQALTLAHPESGHPVILCPWRSDGRSLLTLAHEFGHAMQITCQNEAFVTPVLRETCAFLAEEALAGALQNEKNHAAGGLIDAYNRAAQRDDELWVADLRYSLTQPDATYKFIWNYPPARRLAQGIWASQNEQEIAAVFSGQMTLTQAIERVKQFRGNGLT